MYRGRFWWRTDTEWGVRMDIIRSDNEEFEVGCRFRDEDGFKVAIGFISGIHKLDKWMGMKSFCVMVWGNGKRALRRF